MAITRSQIARQLMQEGGVPRQGYFLGKLVKKFKDDIIPNELKTDLGKAATAAALGYGLNTFGIPGTSGISKSGENIGKGSISNIFRGVGDIFRGPDGFEGEEGPRPTYSDQLKKIQGKDGILKKVTDIATTPILGTNKTLAGLLMTPQALALGSGLLAGAFTKDEEDPLYTGQDVGLNLQDIAKLANISDPKTASAIGLRFSPDVEARKFTPAEMAETYAANAPVDFTEKREQAQDGGMMGDQKDFEEFLQDMQNRDKQMLQDRILEDFKKFMERKRMIEQMPEAKNGGIMKAKPQFASAILGDESDDIAMQLFGKPVKELNPDEFKELMDYIDDLQKSFMAEGGIIKMAEGGSPGARYSFLINKRKQGILSPDEEEELLMLEMTFADESQGKKDGGVMKAKPKMASYGYNEAMSDTYDSYLDMKKNGLIPPTMTFDEFLQEVVPEMSKKQGIKRTMAAEGGMMDMGGMEMDLRGGGFVPMGRAEKADDVPARLSKNEFVFTADAVRAAGGGDVDKGADKMYATMKKLEDRVA